MKFLQILILLAGLCATPLQAEEALDAKIDDDGINIQLNIDADDNEPEDKERVENIKQRILEKIKSHLHEADISDEDREEVTAFL